MDNCPCRLYSASFIMASGCLVIQFGRDCSRGFPGGLSCLQLLGGAGGIGLSVPYHRK